MDAGFSAVIDRPSVTIKDSDRLILVRYPKQVDVNTFKNIQIDLSEKDFICSCGENQYQFLIDKIATTDNIFRPLAGCGSSPNLAVGRKFDESVTILRKFSFDWQNSSMGSEVSPAYSKIPQLDFLQVRSMPNGSVSTVDEINGRKKLNVPTMKTGGEVKKRYSDAMSESHAKKQKKSKKEKGSSS